MIGKFRLELFKEIDMFLMFRKGTQSKITQAVNCYAKVSNKDMKHQDNIDKVSVYPEYLDTSKVYGSSMIQKLPTHRSAWKLVDNFTPEKTDKLMKKDKKGVSFRSPRRVSQRAGQEA